MPSPKTQEQEPTLPDKLGVNVVDTPARTSVATDTVALGATQAAKLGQDSEASGLAPEPEHEASGTGASALAPVWSWRRQVIVRERELVSEQPAAHSPNSPADQR